MAWDKYDGHSVFLSLVVFCGLMYGWDLFHLGIVHYTFFIYLKTKFNIDMSTYLHTARVYTTIPWYTAVLTWAESRTKILAIRGYMLTRHNLVVARNMTLEGVACKVNEYSVSENTLYWCVDGSNEDTGRISIFHNKQCGIPFSAVIKWSIF